MTYRLLSPVGCHPWCYAGSWLQLQCLPLVVETACCCSQVGCLKAALKLLLNCTAEVLYTLQDERFVSAWCFAYVNCFSSAVTVCASGSMSFCCSSRGTKARCCCHRSSLSGYSHFIFKTNTYQKYWSAVLLACTANERKVPKGRCGRSHGQEGRPLLSHIATICISHSRWQHQRILKLVCRFKLWFQQVVQPTDCGSSAAVQHP